LVIAGAGVSSRGSVAVPSTTMRYAHLDADPLRRASNMIGAERLKLMKEDALLLKRELGPT